ncbi:MAG TPA: papain-like cysteine protease family protein [Kofleriaceae bacterium]|nr:papain-like cysteine protease family protein [Kofleriaceae bacterium]
MGTSKAMHASRRTLLRGMGAGAVLFGAGCPCQYSTAPRLISADAFPGIELTASFHAPAPNTLQMGPNLYRMRIEFPATLEAEQDREDWCWAAGVCMVLGYQGVPADQEDLAAQIKGDAIDQRASPCDIQKALNGLHVDWGLRPAAVSATVFGVSGATLIADTSYQWPPLVGVEDHVYVFGGATYSILPNGDAAFHDVRLFDPSPGEGWEDDFSATRFVRQIQMALRIRVQHA